MIDQNDSISPLSTEEATRPTEPSRPAPRSRCPKSQELYYSFFREVGRCALENLDVYSQDPGLAPEFDRLPLLGAGDSLDVTDVDRSLRHSAAQAGLADPRVPRDLDHWLSAGYRILGPTRAT